MSRGEQALRVLVVIDSLSQGGAEQSMMAVLPPLREAGIDAELVLVRSVAPEREQELRGQGVPIRVLGARSGPVAMARALRPILRAERPDLLHVTLFDPVVGGAVAAVGTGVPVLASQAITPPETGRHRPVDASGTPWKVRTAVEIEAFVTRRLVTHLHAVTPGVREVVAERFRVPRARITVAERGRDAGRFRPRNPDERAELRAELGVDSDDEVVVALGRHEPSKGFVHLVEAIARLAAERPHLRVLLAGRTGEATTSIEAAIAHHRMGDRFVLLGDRTDPERILAAGDLFVLSSLREGTSGATIEAMATGLPVVATELPGLAGIVVDGVQALTVPPADPVALADAIGRVLDDEELRSSLGAGGLATFEGRFTLDRAVEAMADLYRQVAAGGRRR